ncbi:hypothetical protein I302_101122 [Kwoniella bestiolae CBS 10118]|uniref:Major facilitator superfamily (MFS) profile domain-containing protein n=1 Tax=Kwoniella bestiolae CBS 10118 TaxID=1296100 RepID=A0A1B9G704_9TREE|nr:hypothetical protein I302_04498 [Kwoniella bestiolae CBS 10118]OCF26808.1 hypothetical protein I302_04498 [Kwoniella bestiolae CBS 10118]
MTQLNLSNPPIPRHDSTGSEATLTVTPPPLDKPADLNKVTFAPEKNKEVGARPTVKLSPSRKWGLLAIFSVAQYLDIAAVAGLFIFTDPIAKDLGILYESSTWIVTAYIVTFSSFLMFFGRVSDLFSAKPVFTYSFLFLGLINLIISFMTNQYAFFVFRALAGVAGAGTIPSAFRLIVSIFEPEELNVALTIFGLSAPVANGTGLIIAGLFGFITEGGQMAAWRWFFRMFTIICVPFSILALGLVPKIKGEHSSLCNSKKEKFKRLDIIGTLAMLFGIISIILGLTLGASYGFKSAKFLVPFLLSWPLFVGFFIWESRLPEGYALIPSSFWKIRNMGLIMGIALGGYTWWNNYQLVMVERFLSVFDESPIIAAVRLLPSGLAAVTVAAIMPHLLTRYKITSFRWVIVLGTVLSASTYLLLIYSKGEIYDNNYWRWIFPAMILGSGSAMAVFLGTNLTVMTSVSPSMSGVAGATLQVAFQVGGVVGLSVQAGFLTYHEGSLANFSNVQASFWFEFGWLMLNALVVLIFYRRKGDVKDLEDGVEGETVGPVVI